jgi:hypothetical protein
MFGPPTKLSRGRLSELGDIMMLRWVYAAVGVVIGALAFSTFATARTPSPPPEVAAAVVTDDHHPAHNVVFPNGVIGVSGVAYGEPAGYRPSAPKPIAYNRI